MHEVRSLRERPRKIRIVDHAPQRSDFFTPDLQNLIDQTKVPEIDRPRRKLSLLALSSTDTGNQYDTQNPNLEQVVEVSKNFVVKIERVLAEHESIDLLVTGEHSLYFHPSITQALDFKKADGRYEIDAGDRHIVEAIKKLCSLAKQYETNLCIGTVCEHEQISGKDVFHNSAIVINNSGQIVAVRRKFTGSQAALVRTANQYINDFQQPDNHASIAEYLKNERRDEDKDVMAKAIASAEETITPIELSNQSGDIFLLDLMICAERTEKQLLVHTRLDLVDIIASIVNEGDDFYDRWSEKVLRRKGVPLQIHSSRMSPVDINDKVKSNSQYFMEAAQQLGVVTSRSIHIASDSAGQAGIFPLGDEANLTNVVFEDDCVVAEGYV